MKIQIKQTLNKLFVAVALAMVLTVAAFAQMPNKSENNREQLTELLHRQSPTVTKTLGASKGTIVKSGAVTLTNSTNFTIGKNFAMAKFDAAASEDYEDALNYTILDLVYLIDQLDGQPEAVQLQKTLKTVVRGTSTALQVSKEIETISKTYLARQKVDSKWYFNAGQTSMNLMISTYMGDDAQIKKGLTELQSLIKVAPKGTAKEVIDPMNVLAQYVAKTSFTEEDYTAIYEGVGNVIDIVSG